MLSVLSVAVSRRTETYIMRRCNLSYGELQAALDLLVDKDLLKVESHKSKSSPGKILVTTEKGEVFLRDYSDLEATVKEGTAYI